MTLCKYKDMFGKLGEGIHSYRIFNIAIIDVFQTIIGAFILAWITKYDVRYILPALFILGIICHRAFCVRTTIDKMLFP